MPKFDGDQLREYKALHEENVLSSWLREDAEGTEEERKKMNKEAKEEESNSGKRRGGEKSGETGDQEKVCESVFQ